MDEDLETPAIHAEPDETVESDPNRVAEDEQSSDDEDGGPDWTKLPAALASSSLVRPVIPKRGEKDHEPAAGGETKLQSHVLDRARAAMLEALRAERGASSKSISRAVWHPTISRAHVTVARGIHFTSMGHSVARALPAGDRSPADDRAPVAAPKRLELLPEEALYLIERGALFCAKAYPDMSNPLSSSKEAPEAEDASTPPMSVQQAYAEMIGSEDLTLEKYQVFAYLRRLGYVVTRTRSPTSAYPTPPPYPPRTLASSLPSGRTSTLSILSTMILFPFKLFSRAAGAVFTVIGAGLGLSRRFDWWRPLHLHGRSSTITDYGSLYSAIRRIPIPPGSQATLPSAANGLLPKAGSVIPAVPEPRASSPYELFYNLYKPSTPFRKTAPPVPDFQLVVINARTTPMPTLAELTALFNILPDVPPPAPRRRVTFTPPAAGPPLSTSSVPPKSDDTTAAPPSTSAVDTERDAAAPPLAVPPTKRRVSFKLDTDVVDRAPRSSAKTVAPSALPVAQRSFFARFVGLSRPPPTRTGPTPALDAGPKSGPVAATVATTPSQNADNAPRPPPRPNPFPTLKQGKVVAVIAVVDAGSVGFFRFGQGVFEEWPMS